jgi:hypothetical protein
VLVARQRHFGLAICGADTRTLHGHTSTAECHLAVLVAVADRDAVGVPLALRADDLIDLGLQQLAQHTPADLDRQREQSLSRCPDQVAERLPNPRWERTLQRLRARDDLRAGYLLHGGSSCPLGLLSHPERS